MKDGTTDAQDEVMYVVKQHVDASLSQARHYFPHDASQVLLGAQLAGAQIPNSVIWDIWDGTLQGYTVTLGHITLSVQQMTDVHVSDDDDVCVFDCERCNLICECRGLHTAQDLNS